MRLNKLKIIVGQVLTLMLFMMFFGNSVRVNAQESVVFSHVLFISSYSYDWESVPYQIEGITSALEDEFHIDYLFMDSRNLGEEEAYQETEAKIEKLCEKGFHYEAVIVGDDAALRFAIEHRDDTYFDQVPIVFEGINDVSLANKAAQEYEMTGIIESFPIKDTIEAACGIYPEATSVLAIVDNSISGKGSTNQYMNYQDDFPDLEFHTLNTSNLTEQEIIKQISEVDTNTILIYLMCTENADGTVYMMDEAMTMVAKAANVPVFRADETGLSSGLFGGCTICFHDMGYQAGTMVEQILAGTDISAIPVSTLQGTYQFNEDVMKQFGIRKSQLPTGSTLVDFTPTFFEKNQYWIYGICILGFIVSIIIIILLYANRKTTRMSMKVRMANEKLLESQKTMDAAIMTADMMWFEYYPDKHIAYQQTGTNRWNLPSQLDHYPESWFLQNITHPDDISFLQNAFLKMDNGAESAECVIRNVYQEQYRWYKYCFSSIFDEKGTRTKVVVLVMDISSDKEQEAIRLELETAKRANKEKSRFLSNMSHDMRTPMNAIIGISHMVENSTEVAELQEAIKDINASGKQLLILINDTLDVSRIENGKLEYCPELIASKKLLEGVIASSAVMARMKNINFVVESDEDKDELFYTDANKIIKIFTNLLSNAVKFTPEDGTVLLKIERIGMEKNSAIFRQTVKDTGIGMTEEYLRHIFEPFSQEKTKYRANFEGSGLGMTIVKSLVEFLGGTIEIKSEVGKGTEIVIISKIQLATEEQHKNHLSANVNDQKRSIKNNHILVAEDHPMNQKIIENLLKKKGYQVEIVSDGQACVARYLEAGSGAFGLIFMDIRMPHMDGCEATKAIRASSSADAKKIPIIAMTANAFEQDEQNSLRVGMNAHLTKPIEIQKLDEVLQKYMTVESNIKNKISNKE